MNANELRREILEHYIDKYGFVSLNPNPDDSHVEANAMLYTSQAYFLFELLGMLSNADISRFVDNIVKLTVKPGLYMRYPTLPNMLEAHDNYVGILSFCKLLQNNGFYVLYPYQIYSWGNSHKIPWFIGLPYYNNINPEKFDIKCMRQGSVWGFTRYCAEKNMGITCGLWLIGDIICSMFSNHTSTKILSMMKLQVLKKKNFIFKTLNWLFYKKVDIEKTVNTYYGENSPFAKMFIKCKDILKSAL